MRYVCQFSCGAASAVAAKLTIAQFGAFHDVQVVNAYIKEEHPDNRRFLVECEEWFDRDITVLMDEKYGASTVEVFRREQYMNGHLGAACSGRVKRRLLDKWSQPGDVLVIGYTAEEQDRLDDFMEANPGRQVIAPLIVAGLKKEDCKAMVLRQGIRLPRMYEMGYDNANCIGCVKGGEGYWRAIREDFPAQFEVLAAVQEQIGPGARFLRYRSGPMKDERFYLSELPPGPAHRNEKLPSCSFFCEIAEMDYAS